MVIYNKKAESGVSLGILQELSNRDGKTLVEIICKYGLPLDPTFQTLIDVLGCSEIEICFKKYVIEKAKKICKTDEDDEVLASCIGAMELENTNDSDIILGPSKSLTPYEKATIEYWATKLNSDIPKSKIKSIKDDFDEFVLSLIKKGEDNKEYLSKILSLLPKGQRKIPYLKQKIGKLK